MFRWHAYNRKLIISVIAMGGFLLGCEQVVKDRRDAIFPNRPIIPDSKNSQTIPIKTNKDTGQISLGSGNTGLTKAEVFISRNPLGRDKPQSKRRKKPIEKIGKLNATDTVTLNFVDAPIAKVIEVLLGTTLNLSYLVDPNVKGTITVRTSGPIPATSVIPMLESALALRGAAIKYRKNLYRIVPLKDALLKPGAPRISTNTEPGGPGFGLHVIPLRHASAPAMLDILRPYAGAGAKVWADRRRNFLLYAGTGEGARDLLEMVALFDVDWLAGLSYGLFPLSAADPVVLIKELEAIFSGGDKRDLDSVRFLPIERLNSVLAIAQLPEDLTQVRTWIKRLDRRNKKDERQIFVYRVKHGKAVDLADILNQLTEANTGSAQNRRRTTLPPGSRATEVRRPATDTATTEAGNVNPASGQSVQRNQTTNAPRRQVNRDRTGRLNQLATNRATALLQSSANPIRIIPDEGNNALVISATAGQFDQLRQTLKLLDTIPLQVLVEVTIAEVTLNDSLQYGVEWFLTKSNTSGGFSALATGAVASRFPGFSLLLNDTSNNRFAALHALSTLTDVNILSSPKLLVVNNQKASLQVGDQVPITTQSSISNNAANAATVNTVSYRDTGVLLEVTPRVNAGGNIAIDILQEVSDVVTTSTSGIDSPTIQQRKMKSSISIQSGKTVVLGGLIRDSLTKSDVGIPILGDLPFIGNLFKTTVDSQIRTELLILITPRVIRDRQEAQDVTDEIRKRFHALQSKNRRPKKAPTVVKGTVK